MENSYISLSFLFEFYNYGDLGFRGFELKFLRLVLNS